jgi:hypothetical protein
MGRRTKVTTVKKQVLPGSLVRRYSGMINCNAGSGKVPIPTNIIFINDLKEHPEQGIIAQEKSYCINLESNNEF